MAESRNLSRAAEQLRVAQPALSRQMKELETDLGVTLLERHAKGVDLTMAGEALTRGAGLLLSDLAAALDRAEAMANGRSGRVVLGAVRAVMARGFPGHITEVLRAQRPDVELAVVQIDPGDAYELLESGEIDAAVSWSGPSISGTVATPLWGEIGDCAAIPAAHPLATRERITVDELAELPLIISPRALRPIDIEGGIRALRALGLRSPLLNTDCTTGTVVLMIAAGRGWTPVTESFKSTAPLGMAIVTLEGFRFPLEASLLWRESEDRPVVCALLSTVLDEARSMPNARVGSPVLPCERATRPNRKRTPGSVPIGLEHRHLRALLEVTATQSIGRAAERLGVTQPALSKQLKEFETMLGYPLVQRNARGVLLTAGGTSLAGDSPALLGSLDRLVLDTTRARRGMEGRCAVGAVATVVSSELLARVLGHAAAQHPHIQLAIEELPTPAQIGALSRGDIDLGLAHPYPSLTSGSRLSHMRVRDDRVDGALLAASHPLASRKSIAASELADIPFMFMKRSFHPMFYDLVLAGYRHAGLEPRIETTYDELPTVWALAAQGVGWAIAFHSQRERPPAGTVAIPVDGFELEWGIDLLWRRDERSRTVHAIIEIFRGLGADGALPRAARPPSRSPSRRA